MTWVRVSPLTAFCIETGMQMSLYTEHADKDGKPGGPVICTGIMLMLPTALDTRHALLYRHTDANITALIFNEICQHAKAYAPSVPSTDYGPEPSAIHSSEVYHPL